MNDEPPCLIENTPARVLVVDDMSTNRKLLGMVLRPPEFVLLEAANGLEALEVLRKEQVDVVLMDVMMPLMDGFEACRCIREDLALKLLPVIMVTALGSTDDVVRGMEVGADEYVSKPFNNIELLARVRSAVERKRLTDRLDDAESVLFALARMVEARDADTGNHCDRLAHMGVVFGKELGLGFDDLEALRRGGVLHDIGKLGIPDAVLLKKGKLDPEEWQVMKQHTTIGAALCEPLRSMHGTVDIVRGHHERWNGTGYPAGQTGEQIPLLARVFQIVDIFDALSSERPYKPAFPREKVIQIMEEEVAKGFWDPKLMASFLDIVRNRPDSLKLPQHAKEDRSIAVMQGIVQSGVMEWYTKSEAA